jgi:hypothetical protein
MFTLQTDTDWGALGRTSGAHTQGKKLRRHDGKVGKLGCKLYGAAAESSAAWRLQTTRATGPFGTQISSIGSADVIAHNSASSHRRRCGVFQHPRGPSAGGDGLIEEGKLRAGKRDVSELDEPHKPRTNAGVAVEVDSRNNGLGPNILGQIRGCNAGWRQVQRQSLPFGPRRTSGCSREP